MYTHIHTYINHMSYYIHVCIVLNPSTIYDIMNITRQPTKQIMIMTMMVVVIAMRERRVLNQVSAKLLRATE